MSLWAQEKVITWFALKQNLQTCHMTSIILFDLSEIQCNYWIYSHISLIESCNNTSWGRIDDACDSQLCVNIKLKKKVIKLLFESTSLFPCCIIIHCTQEQPVTMTAQENIDKILRLFMRLGGQDEADAMDAYYTLKDFLSKEGNLQYLLASEVFITL